jgi:hypothetical protein
LKKDDFLSDFLKEKRKLVFVFCALAFNQINAPKS